MDNVLRWDCGPGCGTTGCGNTPDDIRRYRAYQRGEYVPRTFGDPESEPPQKQEGWLRRLFEWICGGES